MLVLFAGGEASAETKAILHSGGVTRLLPCLKFFGIGRTKLIAGREDDPWPAARTLTSTLLSRLPRAG
jgi:hypothetical protein